MPLNIRGCYLISDIALIALGQQCHGLRSINVSYISRLSVAGISSLATGCLLLQGLSARFSDMTDAHIIALSGGCHDLRKIDISDLVFRASIGVNAI